MINPRIGILTFSNLHHPFAVCGDELHAFLESVKRGLKTEDGGGSGSCGPVFPSGVEPMAVGFEAGEKLEPCSARGVVIRKGPFEVCEVVPNLQKCGLMV